jgi:hypothetical protein
MEVPEIKNASASEPGRPASLSPSWLARVGPIIFHFGPFHVHPTEIEHNQRERFEKFIDHPP